MAPENPLTTGAECVFEPEVCSTHIVIRTDVRNEAEAILAGAGISLSDAIELFLVHVIRHQGLPLEPLLPNETSLAALAELESGTGEAANAYATFDDFWKSLLEGQ